MRIEPDLKLNFNDVLIRPKRSTLSSRKEVDLFREFKFKNYDPLNKNPYYHGIPIMASNMDGVGTMKMADTLSSLGLFTCLVKTYSKKELIEFFNKNSKLRTEHVAMSIGISNHDFSKFKNVYSKVKSNLKFVCVDVANGYSETFVTFIKQLRKEYPHVVIIAGNVVTAEMTEELLLSGADCIKVGIGPGSCCTTRLQTGVGFSQLSAIMECADAAHGLGGHVIADGGCTYPGDISKAFGAGGDFVMLGSMLAGSDQGGGDMITKKLLTNELDEDNNQIIKEKRYVTFYGMSSKTANEKHFGGLKDYRSSEGRTILLEYKGDVKPIVQNILGGLRSTCTYCGARKLKDLPKCTTFIRCNDTHNRVHENKTIGD